MIPRNYDDHAVPPTPAHKPPSPMKRRKESTERGEQTTSREPGRNGQESYNCYLELEAILLEHGRDGSQVGLCRGLVLELLGPLLLHVVRLGLDLALGLKRKFGGQEGGKRNNIRQESCTRWMVRWLQVY